MCKIYKQSCRLIFKSFLKNYKKNSLHKLNTKKKEIKIVYSFCLLVFNLIVDFRFVIVIIYLTSNDDNIISFSILCMF